MFYFLIYVVILSVIELFSYMIDKIKSKANVWRTKEAFLLGVGFFGGAAGAIIGMILFRHKTRHWYFWAVNFLGLIAVAIAAYIIYSIKI